MRPLFFGFATGLAVATFWLDLGPFPVHGQQFRIAPEARPFQAELDSRQEAGAAPGEGPFRLSEREARCLARTVFFEARGEPALGGMSVALVALHRMQKRAYPSDACNVIHQVAAFSWYSDGKSDDPDDYPGPADQRAWANAQRVVDVLRTSRIQDPTGGADHYHAVYVSPDWANHFPRTARIGDHLFYRGHR
ncbi:MAG TPA: cell wall hydrolase [Gammaproteobacteria bacterium]|nr:cell wall hydrolase [Gammaproteobacteria bacterium]